MLVTHIGVTSAHVRLLCARLSFMFNPTCHLFPPIMLLLLQIALLLLGRSYKQRVMEQLLFKYAKRNLSAPVRPALCW